MVKRTRSKKEFFWVSDDEKDLIDTKHKLSGLGKGEFLRKMIIDGYVSQRNIEVSRNVIKTTSEFTNEIHKIGVNINQIAKFCNQTGGITDKDYNVLNDKLEEVWNLVRKWYKESM